MEHEITGHSRKIYKITKHSHMPFWTKVKEIAIEIGIIVFAVSLAAFLERSREHSSEEASVKEFLTGLKTDLQHDILEMEEDKKSYNSARQAFRYIYKLKKGALPALDSVSKYQSSLTNYTGLVVNNGRFEGFKSSGKLITIADKELQNNILDLYQEDLPDLINSTNLYSKHKDYLMQFLWDNMKRTSDSTDNLVELFSADRIRNIAGTLMYTGEINDRYNRAISKSEKIIAEIEKAGE